MFIVFSVTTTSTVSKSDVEPVWPSGKMMMNELQDVCYYKDNTPKYQTCMGLVYDKEDINSAIIMEEVRNALVHGDDEQFRVFDSIDFVEEKILKWTGYTEQPCEDCILPSEFGYFFMLEYRYEEEEEEKKQRKKEHENVHVDSIERKVYKWQLAMQNMETFEIIQGPRSPKSLFDLTQDEDLGNLREDTVPVSQSMVIPLYSFLETMIYRILSRNNHNDIISRGDLIVHAINASMGSSSPYAENHNDNNITNSTPNTASTIFPFTYAIVFSLMISMMSVNMILNTSSSITRCVCQAGMHPLATIISSMTIIFLVVIITTVSSLIMWGIFPGTFSNLYDNPAFSWDIGLYLVFMTAFGFLIQTSTFGAFFTRKVIANIISLLIAIFAPCLIAIMEFQTSVVPYFIVMCLFPCSFGTVIPSALANIKSLALASSSSSTETPDIIIDSEKRFKYYEIVNVNFPDKYLIPSIVSNISDQEMTLLRALPGLLIGSLFAVILWFLAMYIGIAVRPKEVGGAGSYNWSSIFERIPSGKYLRMNARKYYFDKNIKEKNNNKKGDKYDHNEKHPLLCGDSTSDTGILDTIYKESKRNKKGLMESQSRSFRANRGNAHLQNQESRISSSLENVSVKKSTDSSFNSDLNTFSSGDSSLMNNQRNNIVCSLQNVCKYYKTKIDKNDTEECNSDRILKDAKGKYRFAAVNGISNDFMERSITGLIGVNGAGKTTLMSMMLGLSKPSKGAISIFGNSVYEDKDVKKKEKKRKIHKITHTSTLEYLPLIGFVPQHNIVGNFSCQLHCEIMAVIRGVVGGKKAWSEEAVRCLGLMGLIQDGKQYCRGVDLSGGQQRRLMVAMALVGRPPLLILDEPSAGLTLDAKQLLDSTLRKTAAEQHTSIIITEHDLTQVDGLVDEMVIVREGKIVAKGTSLTLKEEYGEGYTLRVSYDDTIELEEIRNNNLTDIKDDICNMNNYDKDTIQDNNDNTNIKNEIMYENRAQLLEQRRRSKKLSFKGNEGAIDLLSEKTLCICKKYDPLAKIKYRSGRDVFISLPSYEIAEHLFALGTSLEKYKKKLKIGSFAFDIATLSDVFIRIADENVKSRTALQSEANSLNISSISESDVPLMKKEKYIDIYDDSSLDTNISGDLNDAEINKVRKNSESSDVLDGLDLKEVENTSASNSEIDPRIKPLDHKQTKYRNILKLLIWKSYLGVIKYRAIFYKMIFDLSFFIIIMISYIIILPYIVSSLDSLNEPEQVKNIISIQDQYINTMDMLVESNNIYWSYDPRRVESRDYFDEMIEKIENEMYWYSNGTSENIKYLEYENIEDFVNNDYNLKNYVPMVDTSSNPLFGEDVVYYNNLLPTLIMFNTTDTLTLYLSPEYYILKNWYGKLNSISSSQSESFARVWNDIINNVDYTSNDVTKIDSKLRMFSGSSLETTFPLNAIISAFYSLLLQLLCGYMFNVLPYIFSMERCNGFCQLLRMNGENNNVEGKKYANITSWLVGIAVPYALGVSLLSYMFTLFPAYLLNSDGESDKYFIPTYSFLISLGIFFNSVTWAAFSMWMSYKYSNFDNTLKMIPFLQWLMNGPSIIIAIVILIVTSTVNVSDMTYKDSLTTVIRTYNVMIIVFMIYPFAFAIPFTTDLMARSHNPDLFHLYDMYTNTNGNSGSNRFTCVSIGIVLQCFWCGLALCLLFSREAIEAVGIQSKLMRDGKKDSKFRKLKKIIVSILRVIVILGTRRTSDPLTPTDKLKRKLYKVEIEEIEKRRKDGENDDSVTSSFQSLSTENSTENVIVNKEDEILESAGSSTSDVCSNDEDKMINRHEQTPRGQKEKEDEEEESYFREPRIRHPKEDETVKEERKVAKELSNILHGDLTIEEAEVDPSDFVVIINKCRREFITQGEVKSEPGSENPTRPSKVVNVAVRDISLTCRKGECLGIVGENGCGKSVMLAMLLGQMSTSRGEAIVNYVKSKNNNENGNELPRIGYVPQVNVYHECLTVRQHIKLFSLLGGIDPKEGMEIASFCGLNTENLLNNFPQRLSGGYKRRLNLAIALITSTEILIADEVAAGVDEHARLAIIEIIDALKSNGCSIILTSQAMDTVERLADRVAIMTKGRLRTINSPDKIKKELGDGNIVTLQIQDGHVEDTKEWLASIVGIDASEIGILPTLGGDYRFVTPLSCDILSILDALSPTKRPSYIIRGVVAPPSLQSVFIRLEQETEELRLTSDFIK